VALHDVSSEPVDQSHRTFEVHPVPGAQRAERGAVERLRDRVGGPVVGVETHTFQNGGVHIVALHSNPELRIDELGPPEFKSNDRFAAIKRPIEDRAS
jgi:hypothetical protein